MTFTRFCTPPASPISAGILRAVEIGSKADAVLANMFENVLEVVDHQLDGRVRILPTIWTAEARRRRRCRTRIGAVELLVSLGRIPRPPGLTQRYRVDTAGTQGGRGPRRAGVARGTSARTGTVVGCL